MVSEGDAVSSGSIGMALVGRWSEGLQKWSGSIGMTSGVVGMTSGVVGRRLGWSLGHQLTSGGIRDRSGGVICCHHFGGSGGRGM